MTGSVKGNPTPEELAAALAVLTASSGVEEGTPDEPVVSRWSDRAAQLRQPLRHGPGAWRSTL